MHDERERSGAYFAMAVLSIILGLLVRAGWPAVAGTWGQLVALMVAVFVLGLLVRAAVSLGRARARGPWPGAPVAEAFP
jgi:hypothetical protein